MSDLFEQLAEVPVPPPPPRPVFDRSLHQRINSRLLVGQLVDLCVRGFAFALWHFFRVAAEAGRYTLTGKYGENRKTDGPRKNGR
ncbi:MAG: hypothetical protein IT427_14025 [Pirellulales bacterium]|nr:hypothetical protein [Pirellulales bacterium]